MAKTEAQFDKAIQVCRDVYSKKLKDYGAAWRIMRPCSITDQIFIKANRIRTLETKGDHYVDEGIQPELIGIVNYAIMGMIQLSKGFADGDDISVDEALRLYDEYMQKTRTLMLAKNHDYDEAWRSMRTTSYTDLILMKIYRTKQIESNNGKTIISEGIEANYMDMVNYAIFGLIKIDEAEKK
ncbi:MAG: DUF1599 domain-containing protein [Paludibacteraceae bacterium]|nr:DUF1599 domain-containing protein [Paludibacteraceae bacterium]MEE1260374.1 DUF1599 domain-containing protein [Paludibacteraceae bacterium]